MRLRDFRGWRVAMQWRRRRTREMLWPTPMPAPPSWLWSTAVAVVLAALLFVLWPTLVSWMFLGGHDWDQMESHRYLVWKTIARFHQFPFWNPYACGGHPAWGGPESDTVVVSPWLPAYLLLVLAPAMRVEVVGMVLVGAWGAWRLASRFTYSPALRAFVTIAFCINGRFALQLAAGHTWHLAYAWTPWVLYFFDCALDPRRPRWRNVAWAGVCLAMMVYAGGIYPLPHTAMALVVYASTLAITTASSRPLVVLGQCGALGVGLSAPKLFPLVDVMRRYPRLVASTEVLDLRTLLRSLTARAHQGELMWHAPSRIGALHAWHDIGMYVGSWTVVAVGVGVVAAMGPRARALRCMGAALLLLALGSFHPYAPWSLLHRLPVFRSQHVPMRWLYPALLPFLCLAASSGESLLRRAWRGRLVIEGVLVLGVAWMAYDIGAIARLPLVSAFSVARPIVPELVADFHTERRLPEALDYHARSAWPLSLPAEMINMGTIACNTFPGLAQSRRDDHDHAPGLGARGSADPDYLGEVYVADGHGTARVVRWTPNEVDVRVDGAAPGAFVVLNQNWDPGWRADGEPALDYADTVAAPVTSPDPIVHFAYRPRTWAASLVALGLTLGAMVAARQWSRRCDG